MRDEQETIWNYGMGAINDRNPADQTAPIPVIAPQNQAQLTGDAMMIGRGLSGSPLEDAAQGYMFDSFGSGGMSPYAGLQNEFSGYSPMFGDMVSSSNDAISDAYAKGTGATNNIRFNRAGTLGGSAWQETTADNEARLASSLADNTRNMYEGQWGRSSGLEESRLGRMEGAFQSGQGRNAQMLGYVPQMSGLDFRNAQMVRDVGDRQFQYTQGLTDQFLDDWRGQRDFNLQQSDLMQNLLRGMLGSGGSSTTTQGGGSRGMASGLGGLLGLAGMFG
jgi:hypothetical protein